MFPFCFSPSKCTECMEVWYCKIELTLEMMVSDWFSYSSVFALRPFFSAWKSSCPWHQIALETVFTPLIIFTPLCQWTNKIKRSFFHSLFDLFHQKAGEKDLWKAKKSISHNLFQVASYKLNCWYPHSTHWAKIRLEMKRCCNNECLDASCQPKS